jgi:ribose transport system ATP-binding protein
LHVSTPPLLEVCRATKRFPGVLALDGVSLRLQRGEVLAVIGENGAGKSTLMNVLAGVHTLDEGEFRIDGKRVVVQNVTDAMRLGIALIHQELNLCDNLDVAANIFLGREPRHWGLIDRRRIDRNASEILATLGLDIAPRTILRTLPIGKQQMVEIAKALSATARILIMDEPTSSLSQHETEALFQAVRELRAQGVSIVYISHRLGEVHRLADRVLVLRDGRNAGELDRAQIDHDRMVRLMVGRDVTQFYNRAPRRPGDVVLEVRELVVPAYAGHPVTFQLRAGEVVGLAGLVGAGRSELLRALFGVDRALGGTIRVAGRCVRIHDPVDAIRARLALVPEDRKMQGLILEMSVRENLGLPGLWQHRRLAGFINRARLRQDTARMIQALAIRTPTPRQTVANLSGGNQQKVVLGKWLALGPRVLFLDEPTRGIDVGAKQEIYHLLEQLAESGVAILFASSEMEEILGISDRVLVMHQGHIQGELRRDEMSEESVIRLATGGRSGTSS